MYTNCLKALGRAALPSRLTARVPAVRILAPRRGLSAGPEAAFVPLSAYAPSAPQGYNNGAQYGEPEPQYAEGPQYSSQIAGADPRRYIQWSVYKKSAALSVKLVRARYEQKTDGSWAIQREGSLHLEFAHALQSNGPDDGNRRFDWANKQIFSLSAVELSTLMDDPEKPHSFYHDPNMKRAEQGTISKRFSWTPSTNQPGTYMMSLNVTDKTNQGKSGSITVPLTRGEFAVLKNLTPNLVWHMLGFSEVLIN